jgi:hypothetical protein
MATQGLLTSQANLTEFQERARHWYDNGSGFKATGALDIMLIEELMAIKNALFAQNIVLAEIRDRTGTVA